MYIVYIRYIHIYYIYSMQHMCQKNIYTTDTIYKSSQGPEAGQNLTETCRLSVQV
jgi:hypothetical protein